MLTNIWPRISICCGKRNRVRERFFWGYGIECQKVKPKLTEDNIMSQQIQSLDKQQRIIYLPSLLPEYSIKLTDSAKALVTIFTGHCCFNFILQSSWNTRTVLWPYRNLFKLQHSNVLLILSLHLLLFKSVW